jgi:hypothetical protein
MKTDTLEALPESKLTKKQVKTFRKDFTEDGRPGVIVAEVRHDDECGNGHNTFAITATLYGPDRCPGESTVLHKSGKTLWCHGGGCCHDEVAKHFPELAPFIKWHLVSTDGPMHYIYHAGDRDCWGLRKGEVRQHTSRGKYQADGVAGVPHWELKIEGLPAKQDIYAHEKPEDMVLTARWVPSGITGEGKERDFAAARSCAVWPEATDEQLSAEPEELKRMLLERLPALMAEFKRDVESLGFVY